MKPVQRGEIQRITTNWAADATEAELAVGIPPSRVAVSDCAPVAVRSRKKPPGVAVAGLTAVNTNPHAESRVL